MEALIPEVMPSDDDDDDELDEEPSDDSDVSTETSRDSWVTGVSFEDDDGVIVEFDFPEGGCPEHEFKDRLIERWRREAQQASPSAQPPSPDTLSDMLVMFVLGFLTFVVFNMMFGPKTLAEPKHLWCVFSMSRGCIADLG